MKAHMLFERFLESLTVLFHRFEEFVPVGLQILQCRNRFLAVLRSFFVNLFSLLFSLTNYIFKAVHLLQDIWLFKETRRTPCGISPQNLFVHM